MDLKSVGPKQAKQAVHNFLARYNCRPVNKMWIIPHMAIPWRLCGGIACTCWNDKVYEGEEREDEKEADKSAAEAFISDPEVIAAAKRLPPPCRRFHRKCN